MLIPETSSSVAELTLDASSAAFTGGALYLRSFPSSYIRHLYSIVQGNSTTQFQRPGTVTTPSHPSQIYLLLLLNVVFGGNYEEKNEVYYAYGTINREVDNKGGTKEEENV